MNSYERDKERFVHEEYIAQELRFSELYHYLDQYATKDIYNIEDLAGNAKVENSRIIWIMWMQGMENAPEIIKKCYDSILKNKPENYNVILLSDENVRDYVNLPDYIWDKYDKKIISETHLSDIIRLELLAAYGGCWIDATVFCNSAIPEYMLSDMFLFKLSSVLSKPVIQMSSWWLAADKKNRIIHAARHILHEYWKNEMFLRDYYLLHIIMSKIIDEDSSCRSIFQDIPFFNSANAQTLVNKLGQPYSEKQWNILKDISLVQKLTYKKRYIKGDVYNYYMALLEGKLD